MFDRDPDRYDDIVNPLKPWRSALLVFTVASAVVLLDVLDLPGAGVYGRQPGFDPLILGFPFLVTAAYFVFWTAWRIGAQRQRRRSRALRDRLRGQASGD